MKTAILTLYYNNYNYGGLLQAFALQIAVSKLGYNALQISYDHPTGYTDFNKLKRLIKRPFKYPYYLLKYGSWYQDYLKRIKLLHQFANKIPHTNVVTASNIDALNKKFDAFICGSDQIWNPIGWQPAFFLDFVPSDKSKISYAASIARDNLSTEQLEYIRKFTSDFSTISVREKKSADLLNKTYPELNVQYMPDPVFLPEENDWMKLVQSKKSAMPFIFAYFLGDEDDNREKALIYARRNGLKILFASYLSFSQYQWEKDHLDVISSPLSVEDFLSYIANATLVLTDSFHAAAFSAIFRTPFYVLPRFKANDKYSMNSRIIDLVGELGIPDRFSEIISDKFEWQNNELDNIKSNTDRLRERGIQYLEKSLCGAKEVL